MNLNEIANEFPYSNRVQFSRVKISEFLPVIWYRLAQIYKSEILSPTGLSGEKKNFGLH